MGSRSSCYLGMLPFILFGFLALQPLRNLGVEHKVMLQRGFIQDAPNCVVYAKLNAALPHTVFVGIAAGESQEKSWKGIR